MEKKKENVELNFEEFQLTISKEESEVIEKMIDVVCNKTCKGHLTGKEPFPNTIDCGHCPFKLIFDSLNPKIRLECRNPSCIEDNKGKPYRWWYRGKGKGRYTSCPRCKASVKKIKKAPAQKT